MTQTPSEPRPLLVHTTAGTLRGTNAQIEFLPRHALADAARLA